MNKNKIDFDLRIRKRLKNFNYNNSTSENNIQYPFLNTSTKFSFGTKYSSFNNRFQKKIDIDNLVFKSSFLNEKYKSLNKNKNNILNNQINNNEKILYATKGNNFKIKNRIKTKNNNNNSIRNQFIPNFQSNKKIYLKELSKKLENKTERNKENKELNLRKHFIKNEFKTEEKNKANLNKKEFIVKENKYYVVKYDVNKFKKNNKNLAYVCLKRTKINNKELYDNFIKIIQDKLNLNNTYNFLYLLNGKKINYFQEISINKIILFISNIISK